MPDTSSVVSHESWFSRLGKSIGGVLVGLILLVIAVALLFWNEGRAVKTYKTLKEGERVVVSVASDGIDEANDGKLVHFTGRAETEEVLADEEFGVSAQALRLRRDVEMYQWKQSEERKTQKKLGGGEETVTTYTYTKTWSGGLIDSGQFHDPAGHENPAELPYDSQTWDAGEVTVGAFQLPDLLVEQLQDFEKIPLRELSADLEWPDDARIDKGRIYFGANPAQPQIGDARVEFSAVEPGPVSIIARQTGDTLGAYRAGAGGEIAMIMTGTLGTAEMFEAAHTDNTIITWLLRLLGFVLMWVGFSLLFAPISVLADVVPFFGNLVGMATGFVSFLLGLSVSLVVIALAWLFFRPLLGILLLAGAAVALYFVLKALRGRRSVAPAAA